MKPAVSWCAWSYYPILTQSTVFSCHLGFPASSGVGLILGWRSCVLAKGRYIWKDACCPSQRSDFAFARTIFSKHPLLRFSEINKIPRNWKYISEVIWDTGSLSWGELCIALGLCSVTFMHLEYSVRGTIILCIEMGIQCVCYLTMCINLYISVHNDMEFAAECHNARNYFCDLLLPHCNLRKYK